MRDPPRTRTPSRRTTAPTDARAGQVGWSAGAADPRLIRFSLNRSGCDETLAFALADVVAGIGAG